MNLAGWRFVLFALIGTAAIVLLASIGVPRAGDMPVDPHTGRRGVRVFRPADAVQEARLTGNARLALDALRRRLAQFSNTRTLLRLEAVLVAELTPNVPPLHPFAVQIEADRKLALRARAQGGELYTRARERGGMSPAALLALLATLEADDRIASATERLFAPLARWNPKGKSSGHRPDELAARVNRYLDRAESLDEQDEEMLLALVRAFRAQERPRARLRWALRAFGLFPDSRAVVDELIAAYLEQERTREAFLVVGGALEARPDDPGLWKLRAQLAMWTGNREAELDARRKEIEFAETPALHERVIALCRDLGRPGDAVPNAEALARLSDDREQQIQPAMLALDAGQIDRALALLEDRANSSDDPAWWRERIIDYAWQDLREDRVIRELRWLHARYAERDYEKRLEIVFRQRSRHADLANLLEARLERKGDDLEVERELIQLRAALGQHDRVRSLLARQASRIQDPLAFFRRLPQYRRARVPGVEADAMRLAQSPDLGAGSVPEILQVLEPLWKDESLRRVSLTVAGRFPRLPESRAFLIRMADRAEDDPARAANMARLVNDHGDDPEFVAAWAERAGWAGDLEAETHARERLADLRGGDLDNRRKLANLYEAQNQPRLSVAQWRVIAAHDGLQSRAQLRLVDALMAAGELEEGMRILEQRAQLPGASLSDQLHVADELFGKGHFDRATRFYEAVLEKEPEHAHALLREGQILAWTNDPRRAIPYLERRLAASDQDAASVRFTLGECHWAIGESSEARAMQREALDELLLLPQRTVVQDLMVAKMLARFDRLDEAGPIFERILAAQPDNVDLALDYADAMITTGSLVEARVLIDDVRSKRPQHSRALRLDGMLALREKRYEVAASLLAESLERFGPNAGTASELARARQLGGDFRGARDAYHQAVTLQPANYDLRNELAVMEDWLAKEIHLAAEGRITGDDTFAETWLAASTLWKEGRTRLGAAFALAHYAGPANVVNAGQTDVETDVLRLDLAATHRFRDRHRVGGGVEFFPGADGNTPVSVWGGLHLLGNEPFWALRARAWWNELFDNPAAAAGLGGRSSGGALAGDVELPGRLWLGGGARYEQLSLDFDGIDPSDPRLIVTATLGWRAIDGPTRVASPHRVESALMPGILGARLPEVLPGAKRNALSIWFNAATYQLLGDAELSSIIPLGERFDYLTLAARYDRHVADRLGLMVEGHIGRELQQNDTVYGIATGLGWRPADSFELAFVGAYGSALGRAGNDDTFALRLGLTWRW
ncbi:MAG: tetratricopeptide repeat protein [Planctomycetota bacterium]